MFFNAQASSSASTGQGSSSATPPNRRRSSSTYSGQTEWDPSNILYPTHQDHPAPVSHPIVVISMAEISNVPTSISDDELFETILRRLESLVKEKAEGGYVLIVLAAEDGNENSKGKGRMQPGVGWWLMRWRRVPREIRKGLKRMYLVHPSSFTRNALPLFLPLLSPKAYNKLFQLSSFFDLYNTHSINLSGIELPLSVIEEEARDRPKQASATANTSNTWGSSIAYALGTVGSYLPIPGLSSSIPITAVDGAGGGYWNRSIEELVEECGGGVPPIFDELRQAILGRCVTTEGIFRLTPNTHLRSVLVDLLDLPIQMQPAIPWTDIAEADPLLPPKIVSRLLSNVSTPLIRQDQYHLVRQCTSREAIQKVLLAGLSEAVRSVLAHIISTLHAVSLHSAETRMPALNLAICIAPDLIKGPDPMEDAGLCMQSGRALPTQMRGAQTGQNQGDGTLVGVLEIWIKEFDQFDAVVSRPDAPERKKSNRHSLLGGSERGELSNPVVT